MKNCWTILVLLILVIGCVNHPIQPEKKSMTEHLELLNVKKSTGNEATVTVDYPDGALDPPAGLPHQYIAEGKTKRIDVYLSEGYVRAFALNIFFWTPNTLPVVENIDITGLAEDSYVNWVTTFSGYDAIFYVRFPDGFYWPGGRIASSRWRGIGEGTTTLRHLNGADGGIRRRTGESVYDLFLEVESNSAEEFFHNHVYRDPSNEFKIKSAGNVTEL